MPVCINAIKELSTRLQTAQNDIDLLESRLAAIEALISTNTSADVTTTTGGTRADALLSQV
jgi:prefoldin subunit 5